MERRQAGQAGEGPTARVRAFARALGFDAVAIARADVPLDHDFAQYERFIATGMHGEMQWLARFAELRRRLDGSGILEGAKSVVCLASRYQRPAEEEAADPPLARLIARYARGRDYHGFLKRRLRRLARFIGTLGRAGQPVRARPLCDDAPILERAWAARAGLGFVGKNGLLIVPGQGSFVLLGEVVTTLELSTEAPIGPRCGACTLCLDACPTDAFVRPFVLDARKCVAYLTIEHRSAIASELRAGVGEHLFGCDDCQTVCPYNAAARPRLPDAFRAHTRWETTTLVALLSIDAPAWTALSEGSPVRRATAVGLARNAAIVLGNRGDRVAIPALERAASHHPESLVRDAAAWARARIGG